VKNNQKNRLPGIFLLAAASIMFLSGSLAAEEGMWTLDNPPLNQLREKYGFEPTPAWLEHIRLSSVRDNDGGSGSFISPNGLVLTNHHVALGQLQNVSTPQKNYVADGFYAPTLADEIPCHDVELNVLVSMENVTARVLAAGRKGSEAPNTPTPIEPSWISSAGLTAPSRSSRTHGEGSAASRESG